MTAEKMLQTLEAVKTCVGVQFEGQHEQIHMVIPPGASREIRAALGNIGWFTDDDRFRYWQIYT